MRAGDAIDISGFLSNEYNLVRFAHYWNVGILE